MPIQMYRQWSTGLTSAESLQFYPQCVRGVKKATKNTVTIANYHQNVGNEKIHVNSGGPKYVKKLLCSTD